MNGPSSPSRPGELPAKREWTADSGAPRDGNGRDGRAGKPGAHQGTVRRAAQAMLERSGDDVLEAWDIDHALTDIPRARDRLRARFLVEPAIRLPTTIEPCRRG